MDFSPVWKGIYFKGKTTAVEAIFVSFWGRPLSEEPWCAGKQTVTKVVSLVNKGRKSTNQAPSI